MAEIKQQKFLDEAGLKHLWSKISMEDYPNNATLLAVLEAINEELEALGARVLPVVTAEDNGKFLLVSDGTWTAATVSYAEEAEF